MQDIVLQVLLFFYHNLAFNNLGITIIEISVLLRLAFWPLQKQQTHYSQKMKQLQPHLSVLKDKHKNDKQAYATAQMALMKDHGVNPAAGCLPSLVQIGMLILLMGALTKLLGMQINTSFLIWNMAKPDSYQIAGIPFAIPGILVIIAAATQYVQTKMMMPQAPKVRKEDKKPEKEEKQDFMESFAEAQGQMIWMFPLMFLFLGTQWPAGLALYWSVSSILSIAQQWYMTRGLPAVVPVLPVVSNKKKKRT